MEMVRVRDPSGNGLGVIGFMSLELRKEVWTGIPLGRLVRLSRESDIQEKRRWLRARHQNLRWGI